jgi:hypothetical protein
MAGHWVGRSAQAVAELRGASGSLAQALWALDRGARLRPLRAQRLGLTGEFIAEFHLGDPADVRDAWRPARRRQLLVSEARAIRLELAKG